MRIRCPRCKRDVPAEQVNMGSDLAYCPRCLEAFHPSPLVGELDVSAEALCHPPEGAWYEEEPNGFQVGASTRSWIALFLIPFMIVWSGGALGGIYGSQLASGRFDAGTSLIGLPFIMASILFWTFALMAVAGQVIVQVRGGEGTVFVGLGPLGWTRRFRWEDVRTVREEAQTFQYPGGQGNQLVLEGSCRLRFGSNLSDARRYFMLQVLRYHRARGR